MLALSRDFAALRSSRPSASDFSAYPRTEEQWRARYDRLLAMYCLEQYSAAECTAYHLFRVLDDANSEVAQARRVFQAFRHIIDTDVQGLLGHGLTLEVEDGNGDGDDATEAARAAALLAGEAVWNRSLVNENAERWIRNLAIMGGLFIETVRRSVDGQAVLMAYDAREARVYYDGETGTVLEKAVIETRIQDPPHVARDGVTEEGAIHVYRRELTRDRIDVFRDGKPSPGESGPHKLGRVPGVWLTFTPCPDQEHGFSAAHGTDGALARADSLMEEIGAVANRYGTPWVVMRGFTVGDGSNVGKHGRVVDGVPVDGGIDMVTEGADGIAPMLAAIGGLLDDIKQAPEFLFTDAGANASGEAHAYKAAAFEMKIRLVRSRVYPALARAIWYGTLMDAGQRVTPEMEAREVLKVEGGPILPVNVKAEVEVLDLVKQDITAADRVRYLQRIGIISGDKDPDEYAAKVTDETAERAADFMATQPPPGAKPGTMPPPKA